MPVPHSSSDYSYFESWYVSFVWIRIDTIPTADRYDLRWNIFDKSVRVGVGLLLVSAFSYDRKEPRQYPHLYSISYVCTFGCEPSRSLCFISW